MSDSSENIVFSQHFKQERGIRQGEPLSVCSSNKLYLFSIQMSEEKTTTGFAFDRKENIFTDFADNTEFFIK